ncbi:SGNH/GDSL hydrolase family protein [Coralloluteibacterium stylophorae]|uniref:SGNH hydrolase-type esterase domain-containing protein n=2 Tax=Coralloluteibacterium stylophorae TaxID=1776034 RepID=A0AAP2CC75_9GAMM|nr:SGNH/GDSL hydrolase family protein [Coralloluteibacterium stylophorae]MBS7457569.1 hypothetical protein [Coralloluteibacterium stylophorae]
MIRLSSCLLLLAPFLAHAQQPVDRGHAEWEPAIAEFEAADRQNPPPRDAVLFVGSSSIVMWRTLDSDFPGVATINRGFGGSDLDDTTHFARRIVLPYRPRAIVMYAGDNDIMNGDSPEQLRDDFVEFVETVRSRYPDLPIAYIAVKPSIARRALMDAGARANALIHDWAAGQDDVAFLDVFTPMLDARGEPRPELFLDDGLHMTAQGYALWRPVVDAWLQGVGADAPQG